MEKQKKKMVLQITNLLTPIFATLLISFSGVDAMNVFQDTATKILSPAGFTFAIWGPIFLFQALFYFYQARDIFKPFEEKISMPYVHDVNVFFLLSWLSTAAWYILWGGGYVWPGVAAMFAYLLTSLGAYLRLGINLRERSLREHIFVTVGWSMLCGWITVAAIVNTSSALVLSGFSAAPIGEVGWTIIVLVIALVIYLLVLFTRNDFVFSSVGVWALIGVLASLLSPLTTFYFEIVLVTALGIIILALSMIFWVTYKIRKGDFFILKKISGNKTE
ncbi:hypothetical protein EU537_09805 [Candidatus Thorarchaeota archaeon]|nr:MAG: hypothetical protein EU537_09805 [Candidatus Thorarchaeota archaeon]